MAKPCLYTYNAHEGYSFTVCKYVNLILQRGKH